MDQFGPFIANFQTNRIDNLLALTEYALQRTEMSEDVARMGTLSQRRYHWRSRSLAQSTVYPSGL